MDTYHLQYTYQNVTLRAVNSIKKPETGRLYLSKMRFPVGIARDQLKPTGTDHEESTKGYSNRLVQ